MPMVGSKKFPYTTAGKKAAAAASKKKPKQARITKGKPTSMIKTKGY